MTAKTPEQRRDEAIQSCFYVDENGNLLRIISADNDEDLEEEDEDYEHTDGIYLLNEDTGHEFKIIYHEIPQEAYFLKLTRID